MSNPLPVTLGQRPVYSGVNASTQDHQENLSLMQQVGNFVGRGLKVLPGCQYGAGNISPSLCGSVGLLSQAMARKAPVQLLDDKMREAMDGWFCAGARVRGCLRSTRPVSPEFVQALFKVAREKKCEAWLFECVAAVSGNIFALMDFIQSTLLTPEERQTLDEMVRKQADGSFCKDDYREFLERRDPLHDNYTVLQKVICATRCLVHINAILKAGVQLPSPSADSQGPEAMAAAVKDEHIALKLLTQRQYQEARAQQQDEAEVPCVMATYQFDEQAESRVEAERNAYRMIKAHRSGSAINALLMVCRARDGRIQSWLVHSARSPHNPQIIPVSPEQCLINPAAAARSHWQATQTPGQSSLWEQLPGRVVRSVSYGAGALAVCWFSGAMLLLPAVIAAAAFLESDSKEERISKSAAGLAGMAIGSCVGQPAGGYTLGATIGQAAHYCSNRMARAVGEELGDSGPAIYVLTCIGGTYWLVNRNYLGLAGQIGSGALALGMLKKSPGRTLLYGGLSFATWFVLTSNQVEIAVLDSPAKIAGLMAAGGTLMAHDMKLGRVIKTLGGVKKLVVRACSAIADRESGIMAGRKRKHSSVDAETEQACNAEKRPCPAESGAATHRPEAKSALQSESRPAQQQLSIKEPEACEQPMEQDKTEPAGQGRDRRDPAVEKVALSFRQLDAERELRRKNNFQNRGKNLVMRVPRRGRCSQKVN